MSWRKEVLIDFEGFHAKHMVSKAVGNQWLYEPVNPRNPFSGKHLSTHQIFSNAALGVALYVRNRFDHDDQAIGVFAALKLSFSRKVDGRYLLAKDEQCTSISLDIHGVRQLFTWVQGKHQSFHAEIVKPGSHPKSVSGYRMESGQFPHALKVIGHTTNGDRVSIDVGLSDGDLFTLSMYCVAYCKLLYPSIDASVIERLLVIPEIRAGEGNQMAERFAHAQTSDSAEDFQDETHSKPSGNGQILEQRASDQLPNAEIKKQQKAIYAVGMSKWPQRNIATIEFIQESATQAAMDRLIKAGNAGDFSEWDKIAQPFL